MDLGAAALPVGKISSIEKITVKEHERRERDLQKRVQKQEGERF